MCYLPEHRFGGDQNPYPRYGPESLGYAKQHGRALADAVERAISGPQTELEPPLRVAYTVATLDLEPLPARAICLKPTPVDRPGIRSARLPICSIGLHAAERSR